VRIANYVIEARLSSLHKWTHMRLHKRSYYSHFVWGRLSVIFGQPHLEPVTVCAHCREAIQRVGEDYLDYCEGCQSVEGDTVTITMEEYEAGA
jgi:hypothetical protein